MDPKGKFALVTGGSQGIGLAIVEELLKEGCQGVSVCDIDVAKGEEEIHKLQQKYGKDKVIFIKTDVSKEEELEEAFKQTVERFGGLDIVVNNAGLFNDKKWQYEIAVNLNGVVKGNLLALKYMSKEEGGKGGVVVNMGSIGGVGGGVKISPIYSATKHAVVGFTRCFRSEFLCKSTGLRVMTICPGTTTSNIFTEHAKDPSQILINEKWMPEFVRELGTMAPTQSAEKVGQHVVHMIREAKSGSVWMSENSELYEIAIPDYERLRDKSWTRETTYLIIKEKNIKKILHRINDTRANWLERIERMPKNRLPQILLEYQLRGKRRGVSACDIDVAKGEAEVHKLQQQFGKDKIIFIKTDVSKEEELEEAFKQTVKHFGGLDIVVNNAGILNDKRWRNTLQINLMGVIKGSLLALKYMAKDQGGKGGVIVNMSSVAGVSVGVSVIPIYNASKHGSEFLWESTGVRVMAICPSSTASNIFVEHEKDPSQLLLYENWLPGFKKEMATMPPNQGAEKVGQGVTHMIREGKSGSVWISQENEFYEINFPYYETLRLQQQYGNERIIFIKTDVSKEADIEEAFSHTVEHFGGLDIVVNNAGLFNDKKWLYEISVNLIGTIKGNVLALKYMAKDQGGKGGVVVNIGSTAGVGGGINVSPIYTATKHGVVGYTRCFRSEYLLETTGVRVMCICPSSTTTNIFTEHEKDPSQILLCENWLPEFVRELDTMPSTQSAEKVSQGVLYLIREGKSGSIWMSQENEIYEVQIPYYENIKVKS
ncbi:hypothetical protein C0J52_07328 [Blattella germanica]|nr:hypothetical protein C0J52_07328 [Blattella germanica]